MALSIDILTIFPGMFSGVLGESIVSRAIAAELVDVRLKDIRESTSDKHRSVDDRPYGGGPGMVFKPEPVVSAVEAVLEEARPGERIRKILLSPQGTRLEQQHLREFAQADRMVILCGHYEGMDERIQEVLEFEEFSIGDYVLTGGEIPAMVLLDGVVRLLPGALGHPESANEESFENGLLDCPHYTRPPEFRGLKVPDVLLSGNHQAIDRWRHEQALKRTRERRADLLSGGGASGGDEPVADEPSDGRIPNEVISSEAPKELPSESAGQSAGRCYENNSAASDSILTLEVAR